MDLCEFFFELLVFGQILFEDIVVFVDVGFCVIINNCFDVEVGFDMDSYVMCVVVEVVGLDYCEIFFMFGQVMFEMVEV